MLRAARVALVILVVLLIAIQFVPMARTNPTFDPKLSVDRQVQVPPDVKAIFDRSCRDCHSDQTVWPWYSHVAPASWLLIHHVEDGREQMNLSEWGTMNTDAARDVLIEVCRQVKKNKMPLPSYTWLHREAVLSQDDIAALCKWSEETRKMLQAAE